MSCARVFLLACCLVIPATADVYYNNTIPTDATSGIGPLTTCGPSGCVISVGIAIDDVLIPAARDPGALPIDVTGITVGIGGIPGTGTTFSLWDFPVLPNASPGLPQDLVATKDVTIDQSGFQSLSFGDGASTLAVLQPIPGIVPGYDLLYLGLSASTTADWSWANGPDFNLPTAWFYNGANNTINLNNSPPGSPSNYSYSLMVEGTALPEPSLLLPLAGMLAAICWRKRMTAAHPE